MLGCRVLQCWQQELQHMYVAYVLNVCCLCAQEQLLSAQLLEAASREEDLRSRTQVRLCVKVWGMGFE